jgi:hypothetical protein
MSRRTGYRLTKTLAMLAALAWFAAAMPPGSFRIPESTRRWRTPKER